MDNELRIVQGNTFATAVEIHAVDATGQPIVDWSLQDSTDIRIWYVFAGCEQDITTWQIDDGKLVILWLANMQRVGTYDIFCAGKYNGADWRNAMQYQFSIVRFNHEANVPANVVILDGIYQLSAELQIITQLQGGGGGTPSSTLPLMDGEAQVGTENAYARGDHRHPTDTSRQAVIADLDAIRSGASAGATAYQKPSTGIPKNDLASGVQTSLGKADTALQPSVLSGYQPLIDNANKLDYSLLDNTPTIPAAQVQSDWDEVDTDSKAYIQNKPTIPAAQVQSDWNEADNTKADYIKNKPTIPSISGLESTSNKVTSLSASSTDTQYPSAKCVYDGLGGKADKTPVVNHGTSDTTYAVTPNALHIWGTVASLTLTLATPTDATIVNEYMFEFTSGSTATTLSLPASVEWGNRDPLTGQTEPLVVAADATYQISIVNNIGLWTAIANS